MTDTIAVERLETDLIYAIRLFHKYAAINPIERNNIVVNKLKQLLIEARKCQTEADIFNQ